MSHNSGLESLDTTFPNWSLRCFTGGPPGLLISFLNYSTSKILGNHCTTWRVHQFLIHLLAMQSVTMWANDIHMICPRSWWSRGLQYRHLAMGIWVLAWLTGWRAKTKWKACLTVRVCDGEEIVNYSQSGWGMSPAPWGSFSWCGWHSVGVPCQTMKQYIEAHDTADIPAAWSGCNWG